MTAPVIPPSPSREEYARDYAAALAANGDESLFDRTEPIGPFIEWLAEARAPARQRDARAAHSPARPSTRKPARTPPRRFSTACGPWQCCG